MDKNFGIEKSKKMYIYITKLSKNFNNRPYVLIYIFIYIHKDKVLAPDQVTRIKVLTPNCINLYISNLESKRKNS